MNADFRVSMGDRLRQERERLGLLQPEMAALGGAKPRTYQDWERGVAAVSAEFLAAVAPRGLDVSFVVSGVSASASALGLTPDEARILATYKQADSQARQALESVAALAARSPAPSSTGNTVTIGGDVGQQVNGDQTVTAPMTFNVGGKRKQ